MTNRTTLAPKHKIFNHKQYTRYPQYLKTKGDAEELAKRLRGDQVLAGVRFITNARTAKFGDEWAVYTWQNRYYSKTQRKMIMRR